MTPRPEAIPNRSPDDGVPTQLDPAERRDEIGEEPVPEVVSSSVTRLAVFSSHTGRWKRPVHGRAAVTATFASVDLVDE